MSGKRKTRLPVILLTGLTVLLALALCWAVLDLWLTGRAIRQTDPAVVIFTAEAVRARAVWVLPVFLLWMLALAAALATAPRGNRPVGPRAQNSKPAPTPRRLQWLRGGFLAAALVLIVLGILNGGLRDVLTKAVNICTECIGLG